MPSISDPFLRRPILTLVVIPVVYFAAMEKKLA